MNSRLTPPKVLFDQLFGQLTERVVEREELKVTKGMSAELVDVKDRLHALRSKLVTARCMLTQQTGTQIRARRPAD